MVNNKAMEAANGIGFDMYVLQEDTSVFLKDIDVKDNSISHFHVLLFFRFDCTWREEDAGWTQKTLRQSGKMPGIFPNNLSVF